MFPVRDRIVGPTLASRGGVYDFLPPEIAGEMARRGPKAKLVEIPGVGHAPCLAIEDRIAPVRDFLPS